MFDTSKIHSLIARARRRLRLQAALESAVTASIIAFAACLAVVYAVRSGTFTESTGAGLLLACLLGIIALGALVGSLGRFPTHIVATRIDRASNLADRLSSACAFESRLAQTGSQTSSQTSSNQGAGPAEAEAEAGDQETTAFMKAAIRDAIRSLPRADVKAAAPFRTPRDLRAASVFGLVAALVAGLYWHDTSDARPAILVSDTAIGKKGGLPEERPDEFEDEDLEYTRDLLDNLKRTAKVEQEPNLERFAREVEELLEKAERGELSKEQLLEELARAENRYMQGSEEDVEEAMADLQETGRELKQEPITRELGKALEKGDLEAAQAEMEKLADKLEQDKLSEKDKQKAAKALEKAAEKFEKKQDKREQKLDEQIAEKKEEMRKLKRKEDEARSEEEKRRLVRKQEEKKRELKKLEREKEKQQSEQKRTLKSLHRNMKQAAKDMQKQSGDKQQQQENRRQASQRMRHASRDTGKVDADRRKVNTQKKVASQLNDLKEAMRRAQRKGNQGMRDLFGKNKKNQDFRRRARGQQGSRQAWRPGQGQNGKNGKNGQGQNGQQPGGQNGQQPGGQNYGDSHDPYLMGDPTAKSGNTKDQSLTGVHGRGPSVRETILSAAQKGFSSRAYEKVYTDYKEVVEEVIRSEKVPSGYKYYVKRYFQKIKPHSMD